MTTFGLLVLLAIVAFAIAAVLALTGEGKTAAVVAYIGLALLAAGHWGGPPRRGLA